MITTSTTITRKIFLVFLVFAGLYFAKDFLIPLAIATVLATLFLPFCKWMEGKKVPGILAVTICVFVLLLALAGIGALVGWQVAELAKDMDTIKQQASQAAEQIQKYIFNVFSVTEEKQSQMMKEQGGKAAEFVPMIMGSLLSSLTNLILVLVYVFLLLYYRKHIKTFIINLSSSQKKEMGQVVDRAAGVSQQYLLGLTKMIVCLWIMYGIGFSIVGIKNALFFAILCGLLEIVPYVGNITGTLITILVSAAQGADSTMLGYVVIVYLLVQFIQTWFFEPLIVGSQVKLNPLATIIALVGGELVWGIPGVILAIPLVAVFKIVCDHVEELKPYGFLLGEVGPPKKESPLLKRIKQWYKKK